ncbi:MAG: hypothetical protein P4L79_02685 [Legionella sp.]|uniref:hypothetical protein n=1 Tax=Legionella sp. TaxID=459 RepID=UPI0028510B0D|nr:hypothetical protein [Legionella sp.]
MSELEPPLSFRTFQFLYQYELKKIRYLLIYQINRTLYKLNKILPSGNPEQGILFSLLCIIH